jgi:hypothetical protein
MLMNALIFVVKIYTKNNSFTVTTTNKNERVRGGIRRPVVIVVFVVAAVWVPAGGVANF